MKTFIAALCLLFVVNAHANETIFHDEVPIPAMQFLSSGMLNKAPTLYLWNEQGEPVALYDLEEIKSVFTSKLELTKLQLTEQEHQGFNFLEEYLADKGILKQDKAVLLLHRIDPQLGACPPCDEAETIITAFLKETTTDYILIKTLMTH